MPSDLHQPIANPAKLALMYGSRLGRRDGIPPLTINDGQGAQRNAVSPESEAQAKGSSAVLAGVENDVIKPLIASAPALSARGSTWAMDKVPCQDISRVRTAVAPVMLSKEVCPG